MGEFCEVVNYTSFNTTCRCVLRTTPDSSGEARTLLDGGVMTMVATSELLNTDFLDSFTAADDFNLDSLTRVRNVLIFFALLVSGGALVAVLVALLRNREVKKDKTKKTRETFKRTRTSRSIIVTEARILSSLKHYIDLLIPSIYRESNLWVGVLHQLLNHHPYFWVLGLVYAVSDLGVSWLEIAQLLTTQIVLAFILCVLLVFEFQPDDGSCTEHLTRSDCLEQRRSAGHQQHFLPVGHHFYRIRAGLLV